MSSSQVSIVKIVNDDVKKAVFTCLELIGAEALFKKPKLKVLLKPNILLSKEPERAATTHPDVIRAVIQWIKQFSPARIIVGESSGTYKRGATEGAFKGSGIQRVCEEEGVDFTSFASTKRKTYQVENPLVLDEIVASELLEEVDLIVNLPKIKTHGQCLMTCSIKNMFGTLILGNKARTHAQFPTRDRFHAALADIYSVSKPQLTVIDGYLCQEGKGPSAGDVVKMDIILAGYDPVALDTTVCNIIGFRPEEVLHIDKAMKKGLGVPDCEILGESIESVKRKFKKPKTGMISLPLPDSVAEYVGKVIFRSTIKFDKSKCVLCGTCWKNCPVDAIQPPKEMIKSTYTPLWDKDKCIACYCCAELCPYEAVDFKMNFIKNAITSWIGVILVIILGGFIGLIWLIASLLF